MFELKYDALNYLLSKGSAPVKYLIAKELFKQDNERIKKFKHENDSYKLRIKLLNLQKVDGTWNLKKIEKTKNISIERFQKIVVLRNLKKLIDFSCNINEGYIKNSLDFLLKDQYSTGYIPSPIDIEYKMSDGEKVFLYDPQFCGELVTICNLFELKKDERIKLAFQWFVRNQRPDGGFLGTWHLKDYIKAEKPKKKNFNQWWKELLNSKKIPSHIVSSSDILNAYVTNSEYIKDRTTKRIAKFILNNIFKKDVYGQIDEKKGYNIKYKNERLDILKVLDLTTKAGFDLKDNLIKKIVNWFIDKQKSNGSWENDEWITLEVTNIFIRLGLINTN